MTTFAIPVRYDTFLTYYPAVTKTDVTTKAGTKKLIGLKDPGGNQALDVLRGDLVEGAVALPVVRAVVGEPVLRF